jgi:hypothetical protein
MDVWINKTAGYRQQLSGGMNRPAVHLAVNCAKFRDIIMAIELMRGSLSEAAGFVNQL